jgi:4-hydroxyphenylpyruvate dioxygenase
MSETSNGSPRPAGLSVATVTMGGSLSRKLHAAADAGFTCIEMCQPDLDESGWSPALARAVAESLGLSITVWQPLHGFEGTSPARHVRLHALNAASRAVSLCAELGAGTLIACSNTRPDAVDDDALAVRQLRELADLAAADGISVGFEALSWGTWISTAGHAWAVVAAAGRDNLGICLDSFHFGVRGENPAVIRAIPAAKIAAVQLAGAARALPGLGFRERSRHYRALPGGSEAAFAEAVRATGYAGTFAPEVFSDALQARDPYETAVAAMTSLGALGLVPSAV